MSKALEVTYCDQQAREMTHEERQGYFDYCYDHNIFSSTMPEWGRICVTIPAIRKISGWKSGSYYYGIKEYKEAFNWATRNRLCLTGLMRR